MTESLLSKLRKVQRLAESGVAGERASAQALLARLLDQHGLTLDQLSDAQRSDHDFPLDHPWEEKVLVQIVALTSGAKRQQYTLLRKWQGRKVKMVGLRFSLTPTEAAEVRAQWAHHRPFLQAEHRALERRLRQQRQAFAHAYIQTNKIYDPDGGDADAQPLTPAELERLRALCAVANDMAARPYQPPRPQLTL